jgi:diadenosine tetraphosphate (Ap4A) HIT family hydrolase
MSCIFCKIITGEIPSLKILETKLSFVLPFPSFLSLSPQLGELSPVQQHQTPSDTFLLSPNLCLAYIDVDSYAFLDIGPLSRGHCLVIPKQHAKKLHELSDESLADLLPVRPPTFPVVPD